MSIPTQRPDSLRFASLFAIPILLGLCGCGPAGEIKEYVIEIDDPKIYTSDLLKGEFGSLPFQWSVPDQWKDAANDQFSKAAWEVESGGETARITLSPVPARAGLIAQVTRWQGQIGSDEDPASVMEAMNLKGGQAATYIDMSGAEESIMGLMVELEDDLWIFKFKGTNAVADAERKRFRKFCESVSIE